MTDPIESAIVAEHERQERAYREWLDAQDAPIRRPCPVCDQVYDHAFNCALNIR
jgi:hypothetical protein